MHKGGVIYEEEADIDLNQKSQCILFIFQISYVRKI